jgi:L-amino acid N-acyltransferase YncA
MSAVIRPATHADLADVRRIYNQGIEDRRTLEQAERSELDIAAWFAAHDDRYVVLVAERDGRIAGWALFDRSGYREVGIFESQGRLDGRLVDTLAMEKLISAVARDAETG